MPWHTNTAYTCILSFDILKSLSYLTYNRHELKIVFKRYVSFDIENNMIGWTSMTKDRSSLGTSDEIKVIVFLC